jgi:hypothetical protein
MSNNHQLIIIQNGTTTILLQKNHDINLNFQLNII